MNQSNTASRADNRASRPASCSAAPCSRPAMPRPRRVTPRPRAEPSHLGVRVVQQVGREHALILLEHLFERYWVRRRIRLPPNGFHANPSAWWGRVEGWGWVGWSARLAGSGGSASLRARMDRRARQPHPPPPGTAKTRLTHHHDPSAPAAPDVPASASGKATPATALPWLGRRTPALRVGLPAAITNARMRATTALARDLVPEVTHPIEQACQRLVLDDGNP